MKLNEGRGGYIVLVVEEITLVIQAVAKSTDPIEVVDTEQKVRLAESLVRRGQPVANISL
ncbi:hypothetical protein D9M68_792150 [compost metagenome]